MSGTRGEFGAGNHADDKADRDAYPGDRARDQPRMADPRTVYRCARRHLGPPLASCPPDGLYCCTITPKQYSV